MTVEKKKAAAANGSAIKRPGVSEEFLRARRVRHMEGGGVAREFRPSCGGAWIPYFNFFRWNGAAYG